MADAIWSATIADKELMAPGERPVEIVEQGKVITDILS